MTPFLNGKISFVDSDIYEINLFGNISYSSVLLVFLLIFFCLLFLTSLEIHLLFLVSSSIQGGYPIHMEVDCQMLH